VQYSLSHSHLMRSCKAKKWGIGLVKCFPVLSPFVTMRGLAGLRSSALARVRTCVIRDLMAFFDRWRGLGQLSEAAVIGGLLE
jgi:hypothetical protein